MTHEITKYKTFILSANASQMARGFATEVCLTHHNGDNTKEMKLYPPLPDKPFESEKDALRTALEYGKAAIDGLISGIDVTKLY